MSSYYADGLAGNMYLADDPPIDWIVGRLDWAIERIEKLERKLKWHNQNCKVIPYA